MVLQPVARLPAAGGTGIPGIVFLCLVALVLASPAHAADTFGRRQWTVDGVAREALVCAPPAARTNPTPAVLAFHGHGGSMQHAARPFAIHARWPEAMVIYPQGLDTPGRLTDPEGRKPGWQKEVGDQGDRDLRFFDAMLSGLQQDHQVDAKRVYATGHSSGGGFTYLLWAARANQFAAFAPSAAVAARVFSRLKPRTVPGLRFLRFAEVRFSAWRARLEKASASATPFYGRLAR